MINKEAENKTNNIRKHNKQTFINEITSKKNTSLSLICILFSEVNRIIHYQTLKTTESDRVIRKTTDKFVLLF